MKKIILFFVVVCIISSCKKEDLFDINDVIIDENLMSKKKILLTLVNEARTKGCNCGNDYYSPVNKVEWNEKLEQAAQSHSDYMAENNVLDHYWKDGTDLRDRVNSTGYKWFYLGENIAQGSLDEKDVIQGWLNSSGHCRNIMNKEFKFMAVARTANYWTQLFGN